VSMLRSSWQRLHRTEAGSRALHATNAGPIDAGRRKFAAVLSNWSLNVSVVHGAQVHHAADQRLKL